jgi:hypothetical protein
VVSLQNQFQKSNDDQNGDLDKFEMHQVCARIKFGVS